MNIYLIGLPASGKSTCGKELAKKIKYTFVDLDKKIESLNNMTIPEMFKISESFFRDKETEALKIVSNDDNQVISCGGGIVERKINKDYMNGLKVYLDCPLKELDFRLSRDSQERPVSKIINIYDLYERRHEMYDYFKDVSVKSLIVSKTVKEIMKEVFKYEKSLNH